MISGAFGKYTASYERFYAKTAMGTENSAMMKDLQDLAEIAVQVAIDFCNAAAKEIDVITMIDMPTRQFSVNDKKNGIHREGWMQNSKVVVCYKKK